MYQAVFKSYHDICAIVKYGGCEGGCRGGSRMAGKEKKRKGEKKIRRMQKKINAVEEARPKMQIQILATTKYCSSLMPVNAG